MEEVKAQAAIGKRKSESSKRKSASSNEWAWKKVPPRPGDPKTKRYKGKTYHWCTRRNHEHSNGTGTGRSGPKVNSGSRYIVPVGSKEGAGFPKILGCNAKGN
jgi:hypothetical protein